MTPWACICDSSFVYGCHLSICHTDCYSHTARRRILYFTSVNLTGLAKDPYLGASDFGVVLVSEDLDGDAPVVQR